MRSELPSQPSEPTPQAAADGHQRETLLTAVFIFFTSVSFFIIQYNNLRSWEPNMEAWVRDKFNGTFSEGDQYRIGMAYLAHFLQLHAHLRINQSIPLLEFLAYAGALILLYLQFRSSPRIQASSSAYRFAVLGFFFAAVQLPILWIFPWERRETLPTAFYLAAMVLLAVRRSRMPFALVCLLALLLTFAQAVTRSDATIVTGFAIFAAAAAGVSFPRSRASTVILGLMCCAAGGATQLYLQDVAFPIRSHAQTVSTFQLLGNLTNRAGPWNIPIFLNAVLPFLVTVFLLRRYRLSLESSDKLVLLICLIYLPMWMTLGKIGEVRIFVPYLFLASPVMAKVWADFLLKNKEDAGLLQSFP